MRRQVIATVFRREIRDILRDRRTLFTMLVLPILLYPALMLGFTRLTITRTQEIQDRETPVTISVDGRPMLLRDAGDGEVSAGDEPETLLARILAIDAFSFRAPADPESAIASGDLLLSLDVPSTLEDDLAAGRPVTLSPVYRSSDDRSQIAFQTLSAVVAAYRESRCPVILDTREGDRASAGQRGGRAFGGILAMMVVLMALTGAFYPALDVAAGEKERGTLETLLLSPASRRELVLGKCLTVMAVACAVALCNLASMGATAGGFSSMLPAGMDRQFALDVSPRNVVVILVGLMILAALFSAVTLAISTFARSYKEGQAYLTPVFIVVMPLGMVGLLPDMKIDPGLAMVPVANVVLLMKGLLTGDVGTPEILITLGSLAVLTLAALSWTSRLFDREEVLFREGRQVFGLRPPPGVEAPRHPSPGVALFGFFLGFAYLYHVSTRLHGAHPLVVIGATMGGLAVIALLLPKLSMVRLRSGLALRAPSPRAILAGVVVGAAGWLVSLGVGTLQARILGQPTDTAESMQQFLAPLLEQPVVVIFLALAVLPGIAEELLFRGLILHGVRGERFGDLGAVIVSASAFGIFHMDLHRFFPQAVLGLALGLLVVRCGSLWPAVLAHAVHNGVIIALSLIPDLEDVDGTEPAFMIGAVVGVGVIALALRFVRDLSPPESTTS